MLVLTRKSGESIRVGESILLTVLECRGKFVKLGITAPPQLPVHREEVYLRIRAENLAAAKSTDTMSILLENVPEELRDSGREEAPGEPDSD
ncbi:MAG: carbon storage regulator CsrA [Fidelibacterota bacterium]|nr:MAG: carbon storage regulator CsrA [Candidatus Neomarinimicrobiota bacterium]